MKIISVIRRRKRELKFIKKTIDLNMPAFHNLTLTDRRLRV